MKKTIIAIAAALAVSGIALLLTLGGGETPAQEPEQTAVPTAEPTPTPEPTPTVEETARELMSGMTDREKVWQLLYVFPQDITGSNTASELELWADSLRERPAGGIVINSENMQSVEQLRALTASIKNASDVPAFIGVDEEGGKVARLAFTLGVTTDFKSMYTYREGGEETARSNAATIAADIASFGFNQDFAPVADVWTNPDNTVIGERAYSDEPEEAARLVAAAVEGFSSGGIISTLKHFPGHGDTSEDSHYAAAHSSKALDELRECELLPFIAGMEAGAGMVMMGHITLDEIDPEVPATLSKTVVTGLLREELGWDGVVITDSFIMEAISGSYTQADAAVLAIEAGCDIILGSSDPDAVAEALLERVSMERIEQSVLRILVLKLESGLILEDG